MSVTVTSRIIGWPSPLNGLNRHSGFLRDNEDIGKLTCEDIRTASKSDYANTHHSPTGTAIEVLKELEEHIDNHATHTTMQMPDARLGEDYSARIESQTIEQLLASRPPWRNWRVGGTS